MGKYARRSLSFLSSQGGLMQCLLVLEADEDDHKQNGLLAVHSEKKKRKEKKQGVKAQKAI